MGSKLTRRGFLGRSLAGVAGPAAAVGIGWDGGFAEPRHPVVKRCDIRLKRLPEDFHGFRIAQISDIHFGPYMGKAGVGRAVRLTQSFRPDLVVLTGGFRFQSLWWMLRICWRAKCGTVW